MKKSVFALLVLLLAFMLFMPLNSQSQMLKVKDAIAVMGKPKPQVQKDLKALGFIYQKMDTEFMIFTKSNSTAKSTLSTGFKDGVLNTISWNEHVIYASKIMGDVLAERFEQISKMYSLTGFRNYVKHLNLTLIDQSSYQNEIMITIGRLTEKDSSDRGDTEERETNLSLTNYQNSKSPANTANKANKPKGIFRPAVNEALDSSRDLTSKKKYCATDGLGAVYTVEIKSNKITIKYVYKDFTETVQGTISNGKIYTNDRLEIQDKKLIGQVYILESNFLKVFNPEGGGGYNIFKSCE